MASADIKPLGLPEQKHFGKWVLLERISAVNTAASFSPPPPTEQLSYEAAS